MTLTQTVLAFITLMIAFIFYDRYNAGNKLNDKTYDNNITNLTKLEKYISLLMKTLNKWINKQEIKINLQI